MYDTLTDTRDGQTYKTVKIGKQTWMAQNLNYQTGGSWCYEDSISYCKKYGRLYVWDAAKKACPAGWKLPDTADWDSLGQAAGGEKKPDDEGMVVWYGAGKMLKSKSGWNNCKGKCGNGTDDYGFSALPGGRRNDGGGFRDADYYGWWWTATKNDSGYVYGQSMRNYNDNVNEDEYNRYRGFSVRCVQATAAVAAAIAVAFVAESSFGTFTDERDGQTYRTVKIGRQTWMAQNINYKTRYSWCFNDSLSYCRKYGRLYLWDAAKKACPAGWKLPDTADWNRLERAAGGEVAAEKLKSKSGWKKNGNGTDSYGFSAMPGGYLYDEGTFAHDGYSGYWWTATETGSEHALGREIIYDYSNDIYIDEVLEDKDYKEQGRSVRCIAKTK
jgi:uncharacterized protein (TIGR02145 family)